MESTSQQTGSFDFLTSYVLQLLEEHGMGDLTDEQKRFYVPQLLSHVERRIGMALLPRLNDEQTEEFTRLANTDTTPEQWKAFWYGAFPQFEQEITQILADFSNSVKNILSKIGNA